MIRVMVVDDHELFRQALSTLSDQEHDMTVVAVCVDGQEAVERLTQARLDVVVTDLVMPHLDRAVTTARVRGKQPELPVLVLTGTPHGQLAAAALAAGAQAVLVKNLDRDDLVTAIRTAAATTAVGTENACPARGAAIRKRVSPKPDPQFSVDPIRMQHPRASRTPPVPAAGTRRTGKRAGSGQRRNRSAISSQHKWREGEMTECPSRACSGPGPDATPSSATRA